MPVWAEFSISSQEKNTTTLMAVVFLAERSGFVQSRCRCRLAVSEQPSTGLLHLIIQIPSHHQKILPIKGRIFYGGELGIRTLGSFRNH